jgi:hypothetical protein
MNAADVLAVMEREAMDRMSSGFPRQADELHEARATVAELIERERELRACLIRAVEAAEARMPNATFLHDARAALSRAKGGA